MHALRWSHAANGRARARSAESRPRRFVHKRFASLCLFLVPLWLAPRAHAEEARFSVTMLSTDQLGRLRYDQVGVLGSTHVARSLLSWLELSLGISGGAFLSSSRSTGGLLAPLFGPMFKLPLARMQPYFCMLAGPGITGAVVRPFFDLSVGLEVRATRRVSLGPAVGYGHLVQFENKGSSTDARYMWVGLSLRAQRVRETPAAPPKPAPPRPMPEPAPEPAVHESVDDGELLTLIERTLPTPEARLELLAPVLFRFDSAELEAVGVAMLHEVSHVLRTRTDIALLEIQGYADQRGNPGYNLTLSERRAQAVLEWLVAHGVARERLTIASAGESAPVEAGSSEGEHEQNRRVIFRVLRLEKAP
jgi:outer membrane protein OmpA-like peptidoglycan-associated protein